MLLICEQTIEKPQYCLPTVSLLVRIIFGGEEVGNLNARDIIDESTYYNLMFVSDILISFYDTL